jgi:hypothetical protein
VTNSRIDPIYPLALKLAGEPGVCALLLGAGISKGAGVPTSWEIFLHSLGLLYQMKEGRKPTTRDDLLAWREERGLSDLTYNSILENLLPDRSARRQYLEGFFRDKVPSDAHRSIAALCKVGLVKVIVTTNFDRLMEEALGDVGITPDAVSSPGDLENVRPRETSPCWLLKLHGDIGKLDIRNTPEELDALSQEFQMQLSEIVRVYSLLVVGYAARETVIATILTGKTETQSLFWVDVTDAPNEAQKHILATTAGLWICSKSADRFFLSLANALENCTRQQPGSADDRVLQAAKLAVEGQDWAALKKLLQRDVASFRAYWRDWLQQHNCDLASFEQAVDEVARRLSNVLLAGLYAVSSGQEVLPEAVTDALEVPLRERAERYAQAGAAPVLSVPKNVVALFWHILGAASVHHENYPMLRSLLDLQLADPSDRSDRRCGLYGFVLEKSWEGFDAKIAMTRDWHIKYVDRTPALRDYFGESEHFATALLRFDFLTILFLLTVQHEADVPLAAWWSLTPTETEKPPDLVRPLGEVQLHTKKGTQLARNVFGMESQDFVKAYPGILEKIDTWCQRHGRLGMRYGLYLPYDP